MFFILSALCFLTLNLEFVFWVDVCEIVQEVMELEHLGDGRVKPEKGNTCLYKIALAMCVCLCAALLLALILGKSTTHTHTDGHKHFSSPCIIICKEFRGNVSYSVTHALLRS